MKILVTGAKGFVGKNLVATLKTIRDGKNRTRPNLHITDIYEYDRENTLEDLKEYCSSCDFVFNLAGINRPKDNKEFYEGNCDFASELLNCLINANNKCPVMLSSSIQASLEGRFKDSEYGKSKLAGEEVFFKYGEENNVKVLVYRFPNLFGKWCRPNYNSVIATFCHNLSRDLEITVNDPSVELDLVYIDDLVEEMLDALEGKEHKDGHYCYVPCHEIMTLGEIVSWLNKFKAQSQTLIMPELENGLVKKLYSTYLSYLPQDKVSFPLKMNVDHRGSFTELMKTENCGQFSVNISKPGITKGEHWHHTKWEFFMVVAGKGLIQMRKIDSDEVLEFYVSGDRIEAVHMLPGYTHNIINLSETEDLVTVMWANELFDPNKPDTFYEEVNS